MTYRQKQRVSPGLIKAMFGDSLKAGYWLDQKPGATVVPDFSGNGHDGTPTDVEFGQRPLAPGIVGRSGYFDGAPSYVSSGAHADFGHSELSQNLLYFAVIRPENFGGSNLQLLGASSGARLINLLISWTGMFYVLSVGPGGGNYITSAGELAFGEPVLLSLEMDGHNGLITLRINGTVGVEESFTPIVFAPGLNIGADTDGVADPFTGGVQFVAIARRNDGRTWGRAIEQLADLLAVKNPLAD